MTTNPTMELRLAELASKGVLKTRTENNKYLKVSYCGTGGLVSPKWNVKIYSSGSVVTTDEGLLQQIEAGTLKAADVALKVLRADDAGWGSPLGGVMVGITDGTQVEYSVVDTEWFRKPKFETKAYLHQFAEQGMALVKEKFKATPATHRVEICTGYINVGLKAAFRLNGYDVRVVEITGLLQDTLEAKYREYIKEISGGDFGYDPKQFPNKAALARKYYAVVDWAKKYRPDLLKDGWESMQGV